MSKLVKAKFTKMMDALTDEGGQIAGRLFKRVDDPKATIRVEGWVEADGQYVGSSDGSLSFAANNLEDVIELPAGDTSLEGPEFGTEWNNNGNGTLKAGLRFSVERLGE